MWWSTSRIANGSFRTALPGRSQVPHLSARRHRARLAQSVRAEPAHSINRGSPAVLQSRIHHRGCPGFKADPARHGTRSDVVVAINLAERLVIIAGTAYAGEIKKAVFTILNYVLPDRNVLPMHCSANVGQHGRRRAVLRPVGHRQDDALERPARRLIGDDEHGWSDEGVFNFEGGCYAKLIRLSAEAEPQIFATTRRFGTVLENVVIDPAHARAISTTTR